MNIFKTCKDGVHKYEPRYDSKLPEFLCNIEARGIDIIDFKDMTYVHDICVRCGDVKGRGANENT